MEQFHPAPRHKVPLRFLFFKLVLLVLLTSLFAQPHVRADGLSPNADAFRKHFSDYFKPIPKDALIPKADPKLINLGRHLFFERALSPNRDRSCNDCHDLSKYGTNGDAAVRGRADGTLKRDVPSIYNLANLELMGWIGTKSNIATHTKVALTSPSESAMSDADAVVKRLDAMPRYKALFANAFKKDSNAITIDHVAQALAAFQQGLITRAPFDDFLLGDNKALSDEQLRGAVLFDQKNCSACHTGSAVGGQMLQKAGIIKPWPNTKDLGYYDITKNPAHKYVFRVPPLRNVSETGPYFHDYSARTLPRAIYRITIHEQGMSLAPSEIELLESFLKSLTGKLPTDYIKPPAKEGQTQPTPPKSEAAND